MERRLVGIAAAATWGDSQHFTPQINGVVERLHHSLTHGHLYLREIDQA